MPFSLSEQVADALLDKLADDDDFRELFTTSPREALARLGHAKAGSSKDDDAGIWTCMQVTQLAPKQAFKNSRDELRRQLLTQTAAHNPINLQA